ncbi:hypothetical protein ACTXT7_009233 [Hymenolepis weldensis]
MPEFEYTALDDVLLKQLEHCGSRIGQILTYMSSHLNWSNGMPYYRQLIQAKSSLVEMNKAQLRKSQKKLDNATYKILFNVSKVLALEYILVEFVVR